MSTATIVIQNAPCQPDNRALNDCLIDEATMIPGIERGSMKALAARVKSRDQVMVFQELIP